MTENTYNDGASEIPEELQAAMNMPDSEYIAILEEYVQRLAEANERGKEAVSSFADLLYFIGQNFGHTKDYPIRVDLDFYEGYFSEKLDECQSKVEEFLEKCEEDFVGLGPSNEEIF